ncbi:unnamed protein product, partial [Owenia fusiformis]
RCVEKIKQSRAKFMDRIRKLKNDHEANESSLVNDLMETEWQEMRKENKSLPDFRSKDGAQDEVEYLLTIFDEIERELKLEEQRLLDEYEDNLRSDETELCNAVERLSTTEVICPLCQKQPLMENKAVIFCKCGLRIDTQQDCTGLSYLSQQLAEGTKIHSAECDETPQFSQLSQRQLGIENLIMSCKSCDFMFIII